MTCKGQKMENIKSNTSPKGTSAQRGVPLFDSGWNPIIDGAMEKEGEKPEGLQREEAERLSAMCLGSLLVLGRGTRAGGGECLCGFVWIIIRVPGG